MFYLKRTLLVLIATSFLGLASPTLESLRYDGELLGRRGNVSSKPVQEGFAYKRQDDGDDSGDGNILCRAVDSSKDRRPAWITRKRSLSSIPAIRNNTLSHAIEERRLPLLNRQVNMDDFMVDRTDGDGENRDYYTAVFTGHDDERDPNGDLVNTAEFALLNQRLDMGLQGLHGCTALAIVSQEAVYFAHYFEDLSWDPDTSSQLDFENRVLRFLDEGSPRYNRPWPNNRYIGLREVAHHFQHGVEVHIMTPQLEVVDTDDDGVEYVVPVNLHYRNRVMQLMGAVQTIMREQGWFVWPSIWAYQALDSSDPEGDWLLDNTLRGKALYQFDPFGTTTRQRARLIMEGEQLMGQVNDVRFGQVYIQDWSAVDIRSMDETTLSCGGQMYSESEHTCYGEVLCPIISGISTLLCGSECYLESLYTCYGTSLCPVVDDVPTLQCGSACYLESQYSCLASQLIQVSPDTPPPYTQSGIVTSTHIPGQGSEVIINGTTYQIGSQASTLTGGGAPIVIGPGTIVVGSETMTFPAFPTAPIVFTADGITITLKPSRPQSSSGASSTRTAVPTSPPVPTQVIIAGSTFTLGPTSSAITADGAVIIIGSSEIVIGTDTVNIPASVTGAFPMTTDGITFTVIPGSSSATSTAVPGGTPTRSLPTPTNTPFEPITQTIETLIASDGSSTHYITFRPATMTQFASITALTSITTIQNEHPTTIVVGPGGVVWETFESTSLSGFPPIVYPSLPPYPRGSSSIVSPTSSSISTDPFPSSEFPLPPIVTTEVTTTGPNGPIVTTVTGTTNVDGIVTPVVTLSTDGAINTASSLVSQYRRISSIINSFSSSTADSAQASAAVAAVKGGESDTNSFGRALGNALSGLCFIFCGTISSAAKLLDSLDTVIKHVLDGSTSTGSLTPLLTGLSEIANELEKEVEHEKGLTSQSTLAPTSSSQCVIATVANCEVHCATGFIKATVMTSSCFSSACSIISSCSATEATSTITQSSFCPTSRQSAGPMTLFSYPGFVRLPMGTWGPDDPDTSTTITTFTSEISSIPPSTFITSTTPPTPTPSPIICGSPRACDADGCAGTLVHNEATCKGNFATCTCIPNANTPGFSCGNPQSCESNNCVGKFAEGKATCTNASAGCKCFPSTNTPGFSCRNPQSCEADDCGGTTSVSHVSTCKNNFAGCPCLPSKNTPGLSSGENLILSDCGIGLGDNGGSTSREMMYYSGDVWRSDGSVASKPNMMVNVPWDGSYPWRGSGVSATFPNGDTFKVTINPGLSDPSWAGYAFHTYNEVVLICYSFHKEKVYQLDDGKWCSSAYVCTHGDPPVFDSKPEPIPKPIPKPTPDPIPEYGFKTHISSNKDFVNIYFQTATQVFSHLEHKFGNGRDCVETPVSLNSQCAITFKCHTEGGLTLYDMASFLIYGMPKVPGFAFYEEDTYQVCKKYDSRPGHEGECLGYTDKVDTYVVIPKSLDINVETVLLNGSGGQPKPQATLRYDITCARSSWSCNMCTLIRTSPPPPVAWGGEVSLACEQAC
ncbi:uncharacterized protein BP5553_07836 [Venustampulla echinocandica]|uniref:Endo-1,3(4)-beta-glucanase 1 carbohydrate binding domain-containing protein n=1 Tax=Venustampulla echinocandica TaxID=2656787 RepID=A0A370THP7_9HELO|nr:uncharacterized protein BP5553_07836 [Venustampulla echinocandica]RDL34708.1 hypothetical protein BP5553_07836 [Venustampulla echinocandica]